ncbi:MAG TPA: hypothetical protein VNO22_06425 [Planctomycetota bacterium]|jgi:hypothetical protein|nr:hypothetical protein [Planctomycetota bacterium]
MGKILAVVVAFGMFPAAVAAQDFGTSWIDRVTHERVQDRGPLKPKPVSFTASGGLAAYFDDNIFLTEDDETDDTVWIPFVGARIDYAEPRFDASADFLGNYKYYADEEGARDYEQRFFGRARYVESRFTAEIVQILRNESDPIDAVFINRAERLVSDTSPRFSYDLTRTVAFEAAANAQLVRFEESAFRSVENNNYRFDGAFVYRLANGYDWLLQGGYLLIDYSDRQSRGGTADAEGWYGRLGFRGDVGPRLSIEALVGFAHVQSVRIRGTNDEEEGNSIEAIARVRYEAMERLTFFADFARLFTFAGGGDPFQMVNRFVLGAQYEVIEDLTARARLQVEQTDSALGVERRYIAAGVSAAYRFTDYLAAEGGATFRTGEVTGDVAADTEFDNKIFHLGVVFTY